LRQQDQLTQWHPKHLYQLRQLRRYFLVVLYFQLRLQLLYFQLRLYFLVILYFRLLHLDPYFL
jgi:hypothetical protein